MRINLRRLHLIILVGAALTAFGPSAATAGQRVSDPLDRPAMITEMAEKGLLLSVAAAGKRLVAVGERAHILISDDNGASWRQIQAPVSVTLTAVRFPTPLKGWALGHSGVVLHSEDAGETWVKQLDGMQAAKLVLDGLKVKEASGQDTSEGLEQRKAYAEQLVSDGTDKPFLDLYFEDEQKGFIVGAYNLIFHTEDGGISWQPWLDHVENPKGLHLYGIQAVGRDLCIAGEQGIFLRSEDRGQSFNILPTPYEGSYFGLLPLRGGELIVYGLRGNAFKSDDHGNTWEKLETTVHVSITAAAELRDGLLVLATQSPHVLASRDKGRTFQHLSIHEPFPFTGIAQAANGHIVLVGIHGVKVIPVPLKFASVSKTPDGGRP
jgi:photosystem II stability/assembly factor-like uncharacterized protein